jgi:hypothetical protein
MTNLSTRDGRNPRSPAGHNSALIHYMIAALSAPTKISLSRPLTALYSHMSQAQNSVSSPPHGSDRKPVVIPYSSRLHEGRALTQDVWTVFKYVPIPVVRYSFFFDML